MTNYMKSEWYRITRGREMYLMTGALCVLLVLINVILAVSGRIIPDFRYNTVSFSLGFSISGSSILLIMGAFIVMLLYGEEKQQGILKNAVAYGLSRTNIFFGKCFVTIAAALCSLIVILIFYIGSACLLLEGSWLEPLEKVAGAMEASILSGAASVILAVFLVQICSKSWAAIGCWITVMCVVPQVCYLLGFKIKLFYKIARWMPWNFLRNEALANMSGYQCLWDTVEGITRCVGAGAAGILIFAAVGAAVVNKAEVQ